MTMTITRVILSFVSLLKKEHMTKELRVIDMREISKFIHILMLLFIRNSS